MWLAWLAADSRPVVLLNTDPAPLQRTRLFWWPTQGSSFGVVQRRVVLEQDCCRSFWVSSSSVSWARRQLTRLCQFITPCSHSFVWTPPKATLRLWDWGYWSRFDIGDVLPSDWGHSEGPEIVVIGWSWVCVLEGVTAPRLRLSIVIRLSIT